MNVLFANYGTWTNNSGTQIQNFGRALVGLGHECLVAVPKLTDEWEGATGCRVVHYRDVLGGVAGFSDGRSADVLHAWTPREIVREFSDEYLTAHKGTALAVHLEDNEEVLLERYLSGVVDDIGEKGGEDVVAERELIPGLIHPERYRDFLDVASGISVIYRTLADLPMADGRGVELVPPIDPAEYVGSGGEEEARRALGIEAGEVVVVYTGNDHFANTDDIKLMYRALHRLRERGMALRLLRTGHTQEGVYEDLEFDRREFSAELGFIPRDEMVNLLGYADIFIQPGIPDDFNRFRLPAKLPEYLMSGKPVILPETNLGAELADGVEALLTREGEVDEIVGHVETLMADDALRERIGKAARSFAERRFSPDTVGGAVSDFYEDCLARAGRTGVRVRAEGS
ncbi:MAG: glycosyltransferase [Verrucomicrobiota bacterium]